MEIVFSTRALKKVREILGRKAGGVYKRIDENRELLELLQREAPKFLSEHWWVEGWLKSHDEFFTELATVIPIKEGLFLRKSGTFPRPWPRSSREVYPSP